MAEINELFNNSRENLLIFFNNDIVTDKYKLFHRDYTGLVLKVGDEELMSTSEYEAFTNKHLIENAHGDFLISGLGICFVIKPLIDAGKVNSITIVEKNQDIIDLMTEYVNSLGFNIDIINEDIFNFNTENMFDSIYFDIWMTTNQEEKNELFNKFQGNLNPDGWMGHWESTTSLVGSE